MRVSWLASRSGWPTNHPLTDANYYFALQNRKNTAAKLELKKYNKYLRRVTLHREIK
jgi:ribosomal protein L33